MSSRPLPRAPRLRLAGVLALASILSCEINKLLQDGGASDPPPARLEFAPPANATAGEPLSPAVRVSAVDSSGSVDTTFQGPVTVTLGENPGRDTLRGTSTVNAERGVATFSNLSINRAATGYTLVATAPGVRGATSPAFDVAPAAAARLAFTIPPHVATVDSVLQPPVQVTAFDTLGNVATGFADNVTVALAANASGGTLGGTTTVTATSGDHTVALADVPANCTVSGGASKTVTVPAGGAATAAFTVRCTALTGSLTVHTATSGPNAPSGYTVTVDGSQSRNIGPSDNVTYSSLATGTHAVQLNGVPSNCTVSEANPQTVTVPPGGSATAAFTITCTQLTGSVTVTTSTSGGTPDSNGYTVTVPGGGSKAIGTNDSVTFQNLVTGSHTVTLSRTQSNCSVRG